MKFKNEHLRFNDPEGDQLTADVYQSDGQPSTGFLILNIGDGCFSRSVRMSRDEARKFAKAIRREVRALPR